jgi:CheY-like chemotaxis protein
VLRNLLNVALIVRKPLQPLVLIDQMEHLLPISAKGVPFSSSSDSSSDSHDILQFSPPSESEQETCLTEFDEEQETRRALEELGREYLSEMPEILYELRSQVAEAMAAEECLPLLLTATTTAHQIRGTAGSLGFPELSRLAGGIEDKLRGFKSDGTASDRQPMARALMLVADIEAWLEAWQDHNQDCMDSGLAGPALEPAPLALVCEDPLANILTPIKTLGESAPRAFIVDKNSERVQSLANVLRAHGNWQVETLTGGVRVLGALEECQPELLILEGVGDGDGAGDTAGMELSGFAICRMIRCHPKWALLPIIIIIADTGIDSRRAVYQAGANDFIVTPLVEEELTNRLLAFLQTHSG